MELVYKYNLAHHYHTHRLLHLINALAGLSIFFFGYDQGMMGGVNNAEDYYDRTMHFGHKDPETGAVVVTNTLLQGGIVRSPTQTALSRVLMVTRSQHTTSALSSAAS